MVWRSIDFHGIIHLDRGLVDQIDQYLKEKETRLANQIQNSIAFISSEPTQPSLPLGNDTHLKLSEAIENFTKKIRSLNQSQLLEMVPDKGKDLIKSLNETFWEFTEVLDGFVVELFQQIKQVNVDQWHRSLAEVVRSIKEMLVKHLDDLIWTIRRLEGPLKEYQHKIGVHPNHWLRWYQRERPLLDSALLTNLTKSEMYLKSQYEEFQNSYNEYGRLSVKVEELLDKMKYYPALALLDINDQNLFIDIFRLLKLRELNPDPKGTLAQDTVRSLKNLSSISRVARVFRTYYQGLKDAFFNSSLELKALIAETDDPYKGNERLLNKVKEYYYELQHLTRTMGKYREFMLQTDSNPYVRSRWGFTERPVAAEPPKAKGLLNRIYLAEELSRWFESFIEDLGKDPASQERKQIQAHQEIEQLLHEMSQPLISQATMRNRANRLLIHMNACDEVSSPNYSVISYIEDVFSKAMRADWKYHVLNEFPLFHELYRMHRGLEPRIEDPAHAFRLERFCDLFKQIEEWVYKGDTYSHVHEIELDVNDMKTYLQDFLAIIQRSAKEHSFDPFLDETIQKYKQQLIEYRYAFGQFFLNITSKSSDGQQLRTQFLFVDQYFDTIESLLNDLRSGWNETVKK